jgi:hypothetical protein
MKFIKSVEKQLKKLMGKNALMILAGAVVVYMIYQYSSNKGLNLDGMTDKGDEGHKEQTQQAVQSSVQASAPAGQNSDFASASGMSTTQQSMPSNCTRQTVNDPKELLPVQSAGNAFNSLNPEGSGDLQGVNLLKAGQHIGMVGQSLRNANLQVRSEPANPQLNVGPWQNTTIEPDTTRVPLELGVSGQ